MTANATGLRKSTYIVQKMDCPAEEQLIRNRLEDMQGIEELRFNLMQRETDRLVSPGRRRAGLCGPAGA